VFSLRLVIAVKNLTKRVTFWLVVWACVSSMWMQYFFCPVACRGFSLMQQLQLRFDGRSTAARLLVKGH